MNQTDRIIDEILVQYKELPECRAVVLFGSRARGDAKQWSDIDLMMIWSTEPSLEQRNMICSRMADPDSPVKCRQHPVPRDSFKRNGFPVNIWLISQDIICERVALIEKRRRLDSTMLIASLFECKILYDPKSQIRAWKKSIFPVPDDYKSTIIPLIFSEVTAVIEDLASQRDDADSFYPQHEIIIALEDLYEIIFLLNGQYLNFTHRIDAVIDSFALLPPGYLHKVKDLMTCPTDARGIRLRWRLLTELAKLVGDYLQQNSYELGDSWAQLTNSAPFLFKV